MAMRLLLRWVLNALALLVVAYIISSVQVSFGAALLAAFVIGALNLLVRPILVVLTLPITAMTLGLFLFVLNALLFWLAALLVPGFAVNGFGAAFVGSLLYSVLTTVIAFFMERTHRKGPAHA
jgi:putative membrane protein